MKDTGGELKTLLAISPQSTVTTGTCAGATLDRKLFASGTFTFITGATTGTSPSLACKVQHDTDSAFGTPVDVSGATVTIAAVDTVGEINVDFRTLNRYVRGYTTTTVTGGGATLLVGATASFGEALVKPA